MVDARAAPSRALLDSRHFVEAPEGIFLALAPAGLVARLHAFLIDLALRGVLAVAIGIAVGRLGGFGSGILLVAFFLLEWLYPVAFELTRSGATPGKRALGLSVVMDSGLPVTPAASLTRNLLRAADFLPLLWAAGAVSMLVRPDFKRLGDLAAGTLVVHVARRAPPAPMPEATPRPPRSPLSPRAQQAIVAWAERVPRLTEGRAEELAALAAPAVRTRAPTPGEVPIASLVGVARWLVGQR